MVSKQGTTKPLCLRSVLLPEVRSCHLAIFFGIQNLAFRKCFPWIYCRESKEFYKTCGFQTNTLEMYYNHLQLIQIVFRQASNATNLEVLLTLRVYLLCLHRCWGFQDVSDLFPASFGEDLRVDLYFSNGATFETTLQRYSTFRVYILNVRPLTLNYTIIYTYQYPPQNCAKYPHCRWARMNV